MGWGNRYRHWPKRTLQKFLSPLPNEKEKNMAERNKHCVINRKRSFLYFIILSVKKKKIRVFAITDIRLEKAVTISTCPAS